MTRSAVRSRYGAAVVAVLFGSMTLLAAETASAKKKKKADDGAAAASDSPAAQAGDTEKPKAIIDPTQEAPKADSLGHVHFASPNTEGTGRVAVKAAPEAKIKVFLEGRYFGTAPVTIYSVPKGDYIVEATYPNGKQVSKPVSVGGDQETEVDLGGAKALTAANSGGSSFFSNAEMTPNRWLATKIFGVTAVVGVVAAVTFGILELGAESDYGNAMTQAEQDEIANRGKRYALWTNIGIGVAAVGLIGAGIAGYPLIFKSGEKRMATLTVTPAASPALTGGFLTLRF